jgi:hypothetical protein
MFMQNAFLFFSFLFLTSFASAASNQHFATSEFSVVRAFINEQVANVGAKNVLVVFDMDNTTMATDSDFGSEHWSLWQHQLIKNHSTDKIAANLAQLYTIQGWVLSLSSMHPVENRIPSDIKQWNARGVKTLVMTSRSTNLHDATMREFDGNGFIFSFRGYPETDLPFNLNNPIDAGITRDELREFNVTSVKPLRFERGVLLTEGQHKGLMLRAVLARARTRFKSIIFIDDRATHLEGIHAAFKAREEVIDTIQYRHQAGHIAAFNDSDKRVVKAQWCAFSKGLRNSIYADVPANDALPFIPCLRR